MSARVSCAQSGPTASEDFKLVEGIINIAAVDTSHAVWRDSNGYPRLDTAKFKARATLVVTQQHRSITLENTFVRLTLLPDSGRIYSLILKATGHEQLWINRVAKPLTGQQNDLGWWMVWGGVEYTIPRGEHGTTWALPWTSRIIEDSRRKKTVAMTVTEPATRLNQELRVSIYPDRSYCEIDIRIRNQARKPVRFSHWVNPMWAPGGRGELTPDTEFIIPCESVIVADRPFNSWMLGARTQDFERNPLRWAKNWRSIGDLIATNLTAGFYAAFSHEASEGITRVFDRSKTPGVNIWTWGFLPPPARQREYSVEPNLGYVEMWGGTAHNFSDDALSRLAPGKSVAWTEWIYPFHGIGGLTYASKDVAVKFEQHVSSGHFEIGVFATATTDPLRLRIVQNRETIWQQDVPANPERSWRTNWAHASAADSPLPAIELIIHRGRREVARVKPKVAAPIRWGFPYMPRPDRD